MPRLPERVAQIRQAGRQQCRPFSFGATNHKGVMKLSERTIDIEKREEGAWVKDPPDWSALLDEALAHVMRLEKTPPTQGLCDCCKLRFLAASESESS